MHFIIIGCESYCLWLNPAVRAEPILMKLRIGYSCNKGYLFYYKTKKAAEGSQSICTAKMNVCAVTKKNVFMTLL